MAGPRPIGAAGEGSGAAKGAPCGLWDLPPLCGGSQLGRCEDQTVRPLICMVVHGLQAQSQLGHRKAVRPGPSAPEKSQVPAWRGRCLAPVWQAGCRVLSLEIAPHLTFDGWRRPRTCLVDRLGKWAIDSSKTANGCVRRQT